MTRIKRINYLVENGEKIDYHYNTYRYQRRLIIDKINEFVYHNTYSDQSLAAEMVDLMYWEHTKE